MIELTLAEIAGILGGRLADATGAERVVAPVVSDHRDVEPGGLFAAFDGARVDGHDFAAAAVGAGAAGVLAQRPTGVPSVLVDEVVPALQRLAAQVLRRLREQGPLAVVAVTGSQGKTSVKDLLGRLLADFAPSIATHGSLNNEIGLPLTVLRTEPSTRHLVLEMGARGIGHLAGLCEIAPPDVSVVLNVGLAHLGEFGSRENIARAKGEIVEALGPGGTAVLNADDPLVRAMARRTSARIVDFGRSDAADLWIDDVRLDRLGRPAFTVHTRDVRRRVQLRLLGEHQAVNAAAALATVAALGLDVDRAAARLETVTRLSPGRLELRERPDGLVVVNDAYNANPASMRAALETLAALAARSGRRTVAVLGEMLELGAASTAEHEEVGRASARLGLAEVVVVGEGAAGIARARRLADPQLVTRPVEGVAEARAWLRDNVAGTDLVLFKASHSIGLERLAEELLEVTE